MAIKQVRANVNGTWHTLTYDSATGTYKCTITAPGQTSYHQTGGYYNVTVEATNDAGTVGTADGSTLSGLRLVVRERVAPVITIVSPSNGAYVSNNKQPVVFNITDESGGSGVDLSSLVVKLDETAVDVSAITRTAIINGYSFTYTPESAMKDGAHTVSISASDNDGNAAAVRSSTFTLDTVPPTLNVTAPADGMITNTKSVVLRGTTNDATSSPVALTVLLNGSAKVSNYQVPSDGTFSTTLVLAEGSNTIVVTVKDAAGRTSSVTRTVTLNTSAVVITSATVSPNPADAGATVVIAVTIE